MKVINKPVDRQWVARALAEETGTLAVRDAGAIHRWIAEREFEAVELEIGGESYEVTVKVASDVAGAVYDVSAEYDDALAVAQETEAPIRESSDERSGRSRTSGSTRKTGNNSTRRPHSGAV